MLVALILLTAVLGLAVGTVLTTVIRRVPAGLSLTSPGPQCPDCAAPIRVRNAVPLLGWLLLRGRCAECASPIGLRYPMVELASAALFCLTTLLAWQRDRLPILPALLYLAAAGLALALIDIDCHRLPNAIVLPSYPVVAALLAGASAWTGDWDALARAGIGGAVLLGFYLLLALVYPAGMGWGDVKLSGILGATMAYLGWRELVIGSFAGFVFGAVVAAGLMAARRASRTSALPFGPFMVGGAAFGIVAGDWLGVIYFGFSGG